MSFLFKMQNKVSLRQGSGVNYPTMIIAQTLLIYNGASKNNVSSFVKDISVIFECS
jgi:hypothetical protein